MNTVKAIITFFNPIARLGQKKYSFFVPFTIVFFCAALLEFYAFIIAKNPDSINVSAIFLFVGLIIYFAFRDGIKGGLTTTVVTIAYYIYIVNRRHDTGHQLSTSIETIIIFAMVYIVLSLTIGWLKQKIDTLIEREADEKKRLQTIIEQLPVGVVITDNNGVVEQTNRQLEAILGIKMPRGLIAGKDLIVKAKENGQELDAARSPLAQALTTASSVRDKELTINRPDGKVRYVKVSASVIHNSRGKIIAAASIINDITQQKEHEVRKDDFVNMASHELKTPVTSMKLYIETLLNRLEKTEDASNIKIIRSIKSQTERLQELINDLLDVSRIQTGKLTLTKELFSLSDLIQETIEELQETTKQKTIIYDNKVKLLVQADRFRIYQVLTNLITNAIKYSPDGSTITIKLKKESERAVVSVKDSGIGIAKSQQKKIFERLYQVTEPREKTFPGLGMGLYISKEIIMRHKGTIWVESEKEKGATFFFTLPLVQKKSKN